jgi:hypothetical protein
MPIHAPKYVSAAKVKRKPLAKMIEFAEQDDVRQRAAALGVAMAEEHGAATAEQEIETCCVNQLPDYQAVRGST